MRYAIAIEPGDKHHAFGVEVPDLPGCFSAGDTLDEAMDQAKEAIMLHVEGLLDDGKLIPEPQSLDTLRACPQYVDRVWAVIDVDLSQLDDVTERINITLPRRVLHAIDEAARRAGETRSGFIARAGVEAARGVR
jgi:predicted RNase H-like HicB family nuclease